MRKSTQWRSAIAKFGLSCLLVTIIFISLQFVHNHPVSAQSTATMNAEISNLRTRINRLEQEVNRLNNLTQRNNIATPSQTKVIPNTGNPPTVDGRAIGRSDPLYQRLATLVVELKEDIQNLDKRLTKIEQTR
ncbi:MAG: hypothetical protein Tsb0014_44770 [Pleurocapsa sp.]